MRRLIIVAVLAVAACDRGPEWVNEQAELANELNPPEPAAEEVAAPDANEVNAVTTDGNEVNAVAAENETEAAENEAAPPEG